MKIKKIPLPERLLIAIGLLMTTTPQFIKHYITLPDPVFGFVVGVGLGLEIAALISLKRARNTDVSC